MGLCFLRFCFISTRLLGWLFFDGFVWFGFYYFWVVVYGVMHWVADLNYFGLFSFGLVWVIDCLLVG